MSEQSLQEPIENENYWDIDPAVNDGFPFAFLVPETFDYTKSKSIYHFSADGFPASTVILEAFNYLKSKSVWKILDSVNDGFPHIQGVFEIPPTRFPKFTGFSISGLGADFKTVSESESVSLPEEMHFRFPKFDAVILEFPKNPEVIL